MNPTLILCRHGNTFAQGEKVVMIGAREDLPLTSAGVSQARELGVALSKIGIELARVVSGPLQRTRVFAEQLVAEMGHRSAIAIDARLTELDYGAWSGLSDEEIKARYGADLLSRWHELSERPEGVEFSPSAQQLQSDVESLLRDLATLSGTSLLVSSNGRLREFGRVADAETSLPRSYKMRTGCASLLQYREGRWFILAWDLRPDELLQLYTQVI